VRFAPPRFQIGGYVRITGLTPQTDLILFIAIGVAKQELQKKIDSFVPPQFQNQVKWITQHHPAETWKVKDDNYELFGLTKDKIGTTFDVPEHWTLAWKYTPIPNRHFAEIWGEPKDIIAFVKSNLNGKEAENNQKEENGQG